MPKIRKKTSNRTSTYQREKVKKKVAEAKRKSKRDAKKDPTWRNHNKEKDLGIPSKFPFKDQILADAAELKLKRDEEKLLARERQKAAHQAASLGLPDPSLVALANSANPYGQLDEDDDGFESIDEDDEDDDEEDDSTGVSSSLKLHAKSLKEVVSKSDVIVQVLDARDPEGTRSKKIEREVVQVHGKKLVLVLNKIDLVPKENVEAWLKYLRISFPTLPFKSSTQSQRKNLSSSHSAHTPQGASSSSPAPLLTLLKNYSRAGSLNVGVIGFPNVGKSSLINTLKRSKACGVAPTPGYTKEVQIISLDGSLKILDCPGVVYEGGDQGPEKVLRNCTAVEQVEDPIASVEVILRKCKKEHLMMLYNIPAFAGTKDFMIAVARSRGRLKKGGVPDVPGTARSILRDWNAGRIPYYTVPPAVPTSSITAKSSSGPSASSQSLLTSSTDVGSAAIATELAPEFDLDALFKQADAGAFDTATASASKPQSFVRMNESMATEEETVESISQGLSYKLMGERDEDEEIADVSDMGAIIGAKSKSKKRKSDVRDSKVVSVAPQAKQKRVNFEDGSTPGGSKVNTAASKAQIFADAPDEAPVQLNKDMKKQAKKAKKTQRRDVRNAERQEDELSSAFASALTTSNAKDGEDEVIDDAAPKPYDFGKFFGAP